MFALDRRTVSVLNTIAVYAGLAVAVYMLRTTLAALLLALLVAYLIEPVVSWLERRLGGISYSRGIAIAAVYLAAVLFIGTGAYFIAPTVLHEAQRLHAAVSDAIARAQRALPAGQERSWRTPDFGIGFFSCLNRTTARRYSHAWRKLPRQAAPTLPRHACKQSF